MYWHFQCLQIYIFSWFLFMFQFYFIIFLRKTHFRGLYHLPHDEIQISEKLQFLFSPPSQVGPAIVPVCSKGAQKVWVHLWARFFSFSYIYKIQIPIKFLEKVVYMWGVRCFQGNQGLIVPCGKDYREPRPPPAFPVLKGLPEFLVSADVYPRLKKCNHRADFSTEGSVKRIQVFPK